MTEKTAHSPAAWGITNTLLLIGVLGQLVLVVACGISFIVLNRLGVNATWTIAPFYVVAPGPYLVSLFHKLRAMEDSMFLLVSFILNAVIYAAVWIAGANIWHRWRPRSYS